MRPLLANASAAYVPSGGKPSPNDTGEGKYRDGKEQPHTTRSGYQTETTRGDGAESVIIKGPAGTQVTKEIHTPSD